MIDPGLPRLLLRAGLTYQLRHRWQALLALIGIAMGVAVVLAVDLANHAAKASFALSSAQLRGAATHRVIGNTGEVPQALYAQLATTPGHPPMAPVIVTRVRVEDRPGRLRLIGLDLFAEGAFRSGLPDAIRGQRSLGEWLSRADAVALSSAAATALAVDLEDRLSLRHQGKLHGLQVFAIDSDTSIGSRDLLVVDIATAQVIAGMPDSLSYIDLVLNDAGLTWLSGRLPASVRLVDVDTQTEGVVGLSAAFELNLTAMSLLALLVGVFLIFNAMSFSIVQRRNLFGRLRAMGVHSREISRLILAEAVVLGIIGTVIGCVLGVWLGEGLTRIVAATVSELYYEVSAEAMQVGWLSLAKAVALGLAGTIAASWLPARQAARTPPLTTLSRAALERSTRRQLPRLAGAGALLVMLGFLVAFVLPGGVVTGFAGLFILLLGAALITPLGLPLLHWLLIRLPLGGVWRMATRDLDRHLSRLGTAAAALMVALSASVGVAVMVESMRTSVSDWLQDLLTADLYIAADAFEDGATLPDAVVREAPLLAQVSAYSAYRDRRLQVGDRRVRLVATQLAEPSRRGFDFVARTAADPWTGFDAGEVLISEPLAHRLHLRPGDPLVLPTPLGDVPFTIAAVFRDFASEHGRVFLELAHYRRHWSDLQVNTIALFSSTGDASALQEAASARFSDDFELSFTAAREIYRESMAVFDRTFRITEVLRLLSVAVAFVGILSALMAVQLERRKEFAVLRALGLTRGQVSLLIMIESAVLGLLAALLAIPAGLAMAWVLTDAIQFRAFGWTMPFLMNATPLGWTLLLGVAAALLAGLYPAWQASRHDPAPQLRED